jgi:protein TonB
MARDVAASAVSQVKDRLVPFPSESGLRQSDAPDCSAHGPKTRPPRAIFTPDPEYTEKALKAHVWGTVTLSLAVGIDGKPREVRVEKKPGYGLDENSIEAARQWKFEPATSDGKPVESKIHVETTFRLDR